MKSYLKDTQASEIHIKYRILSLLPGGQSINLGLGLGCVSQQGEPDPAFYSLSGHTPLAAHHGSCLRHKAVLLHPADPKLEKM